MKKSYSIFFILLFFIPTYLFSQNIRPKTGISEDSIIRKWVKACLNLEVRPNFFVSKMWNQWQIQSRTQKLDKEMTKRVQDSVRRIAYTATGLYILHNNKHYIITARHVLVDKSSSLKDEVFDRIFLIQNGSQAIKTKKISLDTSNINYLGGYSSGPKNKTKYILSDVKEDLAIIALDDIPGYGKQFVALLNKKGYEPISLLDIDTSNKLNKGDYIISFGFPGRLSEIGRNNKDSSLYYWQSHLVTIPVISKGTIKEPLIDSNYFKGNIFIYEGFSGGPVTFNNKLIGINHAYWGEPGNTGTQLLNYYYEESSIFIKANLILPLLRKLEERFSFNK